MIRTLLATTALLTLASACSPSGGEPAEPADAAATNGDLAALPEDATGFITANPLPLAQVMGTAMMAPQILPDILNVTIAANEPKADQ